MGLLLRGLILSATHPRVTANLLMLSRIPAGLLAYAEDAPFLRGILCIGSS